MSQFAPGETIDPDESSIDLKQYLYLFWQWTWLIALAGLLAGAVALAVSLTATPIYQTSTRLLISNPPNLQSLDSSSMVTTQSMTNTYAQMLTDQPVLQGVVDLLKLNRTTGQLKNAIAVQVVRDTQLVTVTVEDPDPVQAANIANATAAVFTGRIRQLQSQRYAASRDGLSKQVSDMEQQIEDTTNAIAAEKDDNQRLQLEARLTEYRRLYSSLVTNYEQVRLSEAQTSTNVVVSEPAQVPAHPIRPKTMQNTLLAVVVGIMLAAGAVLALDALDDTIKNPEEVRQKFNLPILGVIASHKTDPGKPITQAQPRSPVSESFRTLRTNLTYTGVDSPLRRILVTSPTPQDGKTTVATNLAVVMAQGERRVAVIDADLRRPQVHARFGLANQSGLSELFVRSLDSLNGEVHHEVLPRLQVVTSGKLPPNPAELLVSRKMTEILDRLNLDSDLILIDTPPVLTVTDAAALAPLIDGVILVAKPGTTKLAAFRQTLEQMQSVGARVLGVVLNDVEPENRRYGYYYHRYYSKYAYYYSPDGEKKKGKKSLLPVRKN